MKKVIIVTHIRFWFRYSGDAARLFALADFLSKNCQLTIVHGGVLHPDDLKEIELLRKRIEIVLLGEREPAEYIRLFGDLISSRQFDVCIVEHVFLSFLITVIPKNIKLFLDTHDIVSDRMDSFKGMNVNVKLVIDLSKEVELNYFRQYDFVIAIQQNDYNKICRMVGKERTILALHPATFAKRRIREVVKNIGFVASSYVANIDSINWFVNNVWHRMTGLGVKLNLYGSISQEVDFDPLRSIAAWGYVRDIQVIYEEIDIVINPVRCGAGLKIKNIEALANGLPLVTTSHGASGLEGEAGRSFLVADEPDAFFGKVCDLIGNFEERKRLAENAYRLGVNEFSPEKCFHTLLKEINNPKVY